MRSTNFRRAVLKCVIYGILILIQVLWLVALIITVERKVPWFSTVVTYIAAAVSIYICTRKQNSSFRLAGYVWCFVYAFFYGTVRIKQIFLTYFTTVVILTIFNRLFGIRASGHTASSISPCVFAFSFGYVFAGILFAILFCMSVWASLYLKRHKAVDVAMGVTSFVIAFVLAYVYTGYLI